MKLPNVEQAITPPEKFTTYLLDTTHPKGRGKALFFLHFGFTASEWQVLARAFITHAQQHEVVRVVPTLFGVRYIVEGSLETPSGRRPIVRVVWFVRNDEVSPRLVTAYPLEE